MLAIVLGLTSGLTACIVLIVSGVSYSYGISSSVALFYGVGILIICLFTFSTYIGLDKGLKFSIPFILLNGYQCDNFIIANKSPRIIPSIAENKVIPIEKITPLTIYIYLSSVKKVSFKISKYSILTP